MRKRSRRRHSGRFWALALGILWLSGCGPTPAPEAAERDAARLRVVATVAPLANIVFNVSGDRVSLHGLVPPGVNSHTFEPTPAEARQLASADIVFLNGLQLEVFVADLIESQRDAETEVVALGDAVLDSAERLFDFSFPESGGAPNPHVWMDPVLVMEYVDVIRATLAAADPAQAAEYQAHADAYVRRLQELDAAIAHAVGTIPAANRKLLTYHDAWAYFARRYGLTVIGAIQPADMAEPSAQELAAIIRQIRAEQVPVVFGSQEFPSSTLETIARETGAAFNDSLTDDVLPGDADAPHHTYVGMMLRNIGIIVSALGGDSAALDAVPPDNVPVPA